MDKQKEIKKTFDSLMVSIQKYTKLQEEQIKILKNNENINLEKENFKRAILFEDLKFLFIQFNKKMVGYKDVNEKLECLNFCRNNIQNILNNNAIIIELFINYKKKLQENLQKIRKQKTALIGYSKATK